jgi:hypothetical protein
MMNVLMSCVYEDHSDGNEKLHIYFDQEPRAEEIAIVQKTQSKPISAFVKVHRLALYGLAKRGRLINASQIRSLGETAAAYEELREASQPTCCKEDVMLESKYKKCVDENVKRPSFTYELLPRSSNFDQEQSTAMRVYLTYTMFMAWIFKVRHISQLEPASSTFCKLYQSLIVVSNSSIAGKINYIESYRLKPFRNIALDCYISKVTCDEATWYKSIIELLESYTNNGINDETKSSYTETSFMQLNVTASNDFTHSVPNWQGQTTANISGNNSDGEVHDQSNNSNETDLKQVLSEQTNKRVAYDRAIPLDNLCDENKTTVKQLMMESTGSMVMQPTMDRIAYERSAEESQLMFNTIRRPPDGSSESVFTFSETFQYFELNSDTAIKQPIECDFDDTDTPLKRPLRKTFKGMYLNTCVNYPLRNTSSDTMESDTAIKRPLRSTASDTESMESEIILKKPLLNTPSDLESMKSKSDTAIKQPLQNSFSDIKEMISRTNRLLESSLSYMTSMASSFTEQPWHTIRTQRLFNLLTCLPHQHSETLTSLLELLDMLLLLAHEQYNCLRLETVHD